MRVLASGVAQQSVAMAAQLGNLAAADVAVIVVYFVVVIGVGVWVSDDVVSRPTPRDQPLTHA